jgi:DNA repair ATPase RecN
MSEYDKMHDYLRDQSSYDRFPEAWKVKELYDQKIEDLERQLAEARERVTVILDLVYNELAGLEDDTRVEYLYFRLEELEQLKEKANE